MKAFLIKGPEQEEIDHAKTCGLPKPLSNPSGHIHFRKDGVIALAIEAEQNTMTIVLMGGFCFSCLYDPILAIQLEEFLNSDNYSK